MTTRTLISEDEHFRTYEVYDQDGEVIGLDEEPIDPPSPPPLTPMVDRSALLALVEAIEAAPVTAEGTQQAIIEWAQGQAAEPSPEPSQSPTSDLRRDD